MAERSWFPSNGIAILIEVMRSRVEFLHRVSDFRSGLQSEVWIAIVDLVTGINGDIGAICRTTTTIGDDAAP